MIKPTNCQKEKESAIVRLIISLILVLSYIVITFHSSLSNTRSTIPYLVWRERSVITIATDGSSYIFTTPALYPNTTIKR